ncbi:hypothetical protein AMEX_G2507 [Astyanax mexicanus]|uniref:Uncharacterized protein n=1 Tax=Astyanax mexicanus TaxID=7994 RepID=A0A8T2MI32_ASTMX|nr:hypothetical protein AMEX_G2507 [Astyanax mexicanus]
MSSQPGTDLPALPALPQTGDEALAIETAVRTAVLSIMKVFLDLSDNRAQRYQLKLAEMERENFQLKLKLKAAELQLHAGQHSTCSVESYQISADLTFTPETSLSLSSVTDNKEEEQTRAEEASEAVASSQSEEPRLEASDLKLFKEEPNYEDTFWIKNEMAEEGCVEAVAFCGYPVLTDDFSGDPHVQQQQQQQIIPVQRCGACSSLNHTIREDDAPTASSLQRKKLASRERVRQYRARIRADPEKYHMLKEKDRIRYLSRKKTIADLPEPMKNLKRKAWREASKRHRARKLSFIHNTTNICDQHF